MKKTVGIAGAGVAGRMVALELLDRGWSVQLFDRNLRDGNNSCTWSGAGMLAPSCELESAEGDVSVLGLESLEKWKTWFPRLASSVYFKERGSLVVAHPGDKVELERLKRKVRASAPDQDVLREVNGEDISELEPSLTGNFTDGIYFAREAHLDNRQLLQALGDTLDRDGATWSTEQEVESLEPHTLTANGQRHEFDWVIDCRGMGAKKDIPALRGVRGELLYIHAPEVNLTRPVRLMHPRYPIYIVPREKDIYLVGATAIESEDLSPISGAIRTGTPVGRLYPAHRFCRWSIDETLTDCRPALTDNRPKLFHQEGLMRINGPLPTRIPGLTSTGRIRSRVPG